MKNIVRLIAPMACVILGAALASAYTRKLDEQPWQTCRRLTESSGDPGECTACCQVIVGEMEGKDVLDCWIGCVNGGPE